MERKTFLSLFTAYCETQKQKIGKPVPYGITQSTFKSYTGRGKTLNSYFIENNLMNMENLTNKDCEGLHQWLLTSKEFSSVYAAKTIKLLKTVLKFAFDTQILPFQPLKTFIVHQKRPAIVYLTETELQSLEEYNFVSPRLQQIADLFIFQSYTGLSYCDLMAFNRTYLSEHDSGTYFIKYARQKIDGSRAVIPLLKPALLILRKYGFELPQISNTKYNSYLKEVADIAGIEKHLTTHIARKTCATMMLNKGYSIESVSRMLGHSNIRTTQSEYAEVLEERLLLESNGKTGLIVSAATQLSMAI